MFISYYVINVNILIYVGLHALISTSYVKGNPLFTVISDLVSESKKIFGVQVYFWEVTF